MNNYVAHARVTGGVAKGIWTSLPERQPLRGALLRRCREECPRSGRRCRESARVAGAGAERVPAVPRESKRRCRESARVASAGAERVPAGARSSTKARTGPRAAHPPKHPERGPALPKPAQPCTASLSSPPPDARLGESFTKARTGPRAPQPPKHPGARPSPAALPSLQPCAETSTARSA